ncbi:hypothetical protein [Amycolatopsis sp. NPDC059657]|uniref:hypothetical protein n=1 Tax=Amycolatopsis sp. NPDC059657 TaxID=3346899 RepID=UPI00366C61E8
MTINWSGLFEVFAISLGAVLVLTTLFSFGVRGLSSHADARAEGGSGTVALTASVACFAVCAAMVLYGIYLIIV